MTSFAEVHCERALSIGAQPQLPHVLALDVLDPGPWHRSQRYRSIAAEARQLARPTMIVRSGSKLHVGRVTFTAST
jgi:hypothetical protein